MPSICDTFNEYDFKRLEYLDSLPPEKRKEILNNSDRIFKHLFLSKSSTPSTSTSTPSGSFTGNVVINGSAMVYTGSSGSYSRCAPNVGLFSG